jgi:hypothetical protein
MLPRHSFALHSQLCLLCSYELLLGRIGHVSVQDIEQMAERFRLAGDARDVVAARDSLLGLRPFVT